MPRFQLVSLPQQSFPEQFKNKARWNGARSRRHADFYTIGYAGRNICEFVSLLNDAGISTLVDIRHTPISHKPEFSKAYLKRYLENNGLEYMHRPDLGVPRDVRAEAVGQKTRDIIWQWYDSYVVPRLAGRNLDEFFNWADHPVALMCVECDPSACHRHRLAIALERHGLRGYDL
ncbi:MAG: DUF488 domain-containing protein [Chloroflexi bacterium]|nr:DUF488 domain-containing protein [Chloroflexota bacterium]